MEGNTILALFVFFPIVGAFIVYGIGRYQKAARDTAAIAVGVIEFAMLCYGAFGIGHADLRIPEVCGLGLHFGLDGFRGLYGVIASLMWMMTLLFSKEYFAHYRNRNRYYLFNLLTLGATLGVFLSEDLFTTFIFFEMMSFTSYVWVAQEEKKEALRAAETYLAVAVIGGLVMLMGLFLLYHELGTLEMAELLTASQASENKELLYIAGVCILFGFGAKAGAFPLHIWLPKAHPVAPAPASALLSGILTKSGIFGILVVSTNIFLYDMAWGLLLLSIGIITMFIGALLAVCSIDLKRTLACSSMSQIGFILIGSGMQCILGEENGVAVRGTLLHMVNHSLIKLVLFMIAGAVFMNIHKLNLNEIRGYGRKKPLLRFTFLMGALGIGGIPFWNGYVSKTLLHESILEGVSKFTELSMNGEAAFLRATEWIFLISGGMTVAYMTKLFVAVFVERNAEEKVQKAYDEQKHVMNPLSAFAITASAILLPVMGFFPRQVMNRIADMGQGFLHLPQFHEEVSYYNWENLKGGLISVAIGVALYVGIRCFLMRKENGCKVYKNGLPKWLDLEEVLYRPVLLKILPFLLRMVFRIFDSLVDTLILLLRKTIYRDRKIPHELSEGSELTHIVGSICNWFRVRKRRLLHQASPENEVSYEHKLAMQREKLVETNTIIERSLSFGLLLFYVGLVFTLLYLLLEG